MKEWRKIFWIKNQSRAMISMRLSDLIFAGVKVNKPCKYRTVVDNGRIVIEFRQ